MKHPFTHRTLRSRFHSIATLLALLATPVAVSAQTAWVARNGDIIAVDLATGDRSTLATSGHVLTGYRGLVRENATSLLACGGNAMGSAVVRIAIADGTSTLVSHATLAGTGPAFGFTRAIEMESPTSAFVVASVSGGPLEMGLFRVDLATGDRAAVSTNSVGSGPIWFTPWDLTPAMSGGEIALLNVSGGIYIIDIASGARTLLSGLSAYSIELLDDGDLVVESFTALQRVDATSGAATVLTGGTPTPVGAGPALANARAVAVDELGGLWVVDVDLDALFSVDVTTGDRTIISQTTPPMGTGPSIVGGTFDDFNDSMHLVVTNPSTAAAAHWDGF